MAGGAQLLSAIPVTGDRVFPVIFTHEMPESFGYQASLPSEGIWRVFYRAPTPIPAGTPKMLLECQTSLAGSGNARLNIKWKSWGAGEVPAAASLNAEGVQTIAFTTPAYKLTRLIVTLDADTFVANELVQVDLVGDPTGGLWTLSATLGVLPPNIYWE